MSPSLPKTITGLSRNGLAGRGLALRVFAIVGFAASAAVAASNPYFRIAVVDEQTSRGVPAVRLRTSDSGEQWTDSRGMAAFLESDLMGKDVWFSVETYGYSLSDGGSGVVLHPVAGGAATITLHREYPAQRLYRITGVNVYADSILLGDTVPQAQDSTVCPVVGQDGGNAVVFNDKLYWMWGDTNISRYPLGVFNSTSAVSLLPGQDGWDPDDGIALTYFRRPDGDAKGMANITNERGGPVWLGDLRAVKDSENRERLFAFYMKVEAPMHVYEKGIALFNEATESFNAVKAFSANSNIEPGYNPFDCQMGSTKYIVYSSPWPNVRVPATYEAIQDIANYEAFTCLKQGSRFDGTAGQLDRDARGDLVWGWKANTTPIGETEHKTLLNKGLTQSDEVYYKSLDINTGAVVQPHSGSVNWNAYRNRWICIREETWGKSWMGEIWYSEADTPVGPWVYAQKIVSHYLRTTETYTYYLPAQHPMFDKDGGRVIYFEGCFNTSYSNAPYPIPEYDYNEMMYKLELDDPRLILPVPVYRAASGATKLYRTKNDLSDSDSSRTIICLAPDRERANTIPIYEKPDPDHPGHMLLTLSGGGSPAPLVAFYAVANDTPRPADTDLALAVPLYEYVSESGPRVYDTADSLSVEGYARSAQPLCRVWPYALRFNPYEQ